MPYCSKCGSAVEPNSAFCPNCGNPLTSPQAQPQPQPYASVYVEQVPPSLENVSDAWYLVPFLFLIVGGLIAWYVNKDRNPGKARNLLIFGIVWTVIVLILYSLFFFFFIFAVSIPL